MTLFQEYTRKPKVSVPKKVSTSRAVTLLVGFPVHLIAYLFLCPLYSSALEPPSPPVADACKPLTGAVEIQASSVEERLLRGLPVSINRALIKGRTINLVGKNVKFALRMTDSIIEANLDFRNTVFADGLDLSKSCIRGIFYGERAHFGTDINFSSTIFEGPVVLNSASISGAIGAFRAQFRGGADFSRAHINGDGVDFTEAHFMQGANFMGTVVDYQGVFEGAIFDQDAAFERAEFGSSAWFRERPTEGRTIPGAVFNGVANFKGAKIGGQANFIGVKFADEIRMTRTRFDEAYFWRAQALPCTGKPSGCKDVSFGDAEYGVLDFGGDGQGMKISPDRVINLTGLTYGRNNSLPYMLHLLEKLEPVYNRQPYLYLEKWYRDRGDRATADDIYFERRRAEGDKISKLDFARWILDRVSRFVFGYGVKMSVPFIWVAALIGLCALVLGGRDALARTLPLLWPGADTSRWPAWKRFGVSLWVSINLLIPKASLPFADRWTVRDEPVKLLGFRLPLTYKNLASAARVTAWVIVTISVSVFSISDLIKSS